MHIRMEVSGADMHKHRSVYTVRCREIITVQIHTYMQTTVRSCVVLT